MPGSSASISDATVTQTLLGKFTTSDPDTTRKVTSPANPQQPAPSDYLTTLYRKFHQRWYAGSRGDYPYVQRRPSIRLTSPTATTLSRAPYERRNPPFFEVVAATSPAFNIRVKAGVTLAAAVSPYVMHVDCTDAVTAVSSTFTQPVLDKASTFISGINWNSPDVSDDTVIATSLGKFTTTDPDTTCSVTLPVTNVYEIRKVASPTDPQKPEFEVWISNAVTQASIDFNDPPVPLPLTINCTDGNVLNDITGTFNVNIVDSPPTFVSGIPGSSPNVSDSIVTETLLGKFTTTDPDTACSVRSPSTTVYEIRNVTSPVNVSQPEFEVRISSTMTEAAIDFNDKAVPLTLTIRCTDGNPVNVITGTFNVNIVDEV
ncbi:uncharacterized protein LOC127864685 [Dreissena polymorpha]|uniref:uncharacterized protein LOC127864685 n=1 Tax=Dreissena polymorpha TaxID=45954 RepID=UPI002264C0AD|nr:uncharacterized protein LOC127864685 [Dreissena polymorpha]